MKRIVSILAVIAVSGGIAARAADSAQINGWISDSMCGAKHSGSGSACVKKCIEGGMTPVFVDEQKKAVWSIDNPDAVKGFYGDHETINAIGDSDKNGIHIDSIPQQGKVFDRFCFATTTRHTSQSLVVSYPLPFQWHAVASEREDGECIGKTHGKSNLER